MDKTKIIAYYIIFIVGLIIEIVFLFKIPYYRYSNFLKYLKIIRILLGFFIFLIDVYFRVISITETLLNKKGKISSKDKYFADKNFFFLVDKLLIIAAFVISFATLILNITGIVLASKNITSDNKTTLKNIYSTCTLLLLFENILFTIAWIYFTIYWGYYINYNIFKVKNGDDRRTSSTEAISNPNAFTNDGESEGRGGVVPPAPPGFVGQEGRSSEREANNIENDKDNIIHDI